MGGRSKLSERRPLLPRVPVSDPAPRYPHARRFRAVVSTVLAVVLVFILAQLFLVPGPTYLPQSVATTFAEWVFGYEWSSENRTPLEELENVMLSTPDEEHAKAWTQYYTSGPHLAGKNLSQALYTKDRFEEFGIPAEIVTYEIYTNYPLSHRLALLKVCEDGSSGASVSDNDLELLFEASLTEPALEEDPTSGLDNRIPTFHGYSANGNVTSEYIWANYGTHRDYDDLLRKDVNITGKVVLCRYGKIFRGLKVKRAQELGAIGVLIYSDPGDDGDMTELNGHEAYPKGPARNRYSVQRGSVQFLSFAPGDPTTPGRPSLPGAPRDDPQRYIPSIPSLPISYDDALPLLKALNGQGLNASDLGGNWGTGGLYHEGVKYNVGPAPGIVVNMVNEVEYDIVPQWDVIARIEGYIKDETVLVGNHRDAWVAGGAGDPNSGSSALLEMARTFGKMLASGWKPARTIILASWDGEEYGLLGSTEWVEDNAHYLKKNALAYINVDMAARSHVLKTSANPLLNDVLHGATSKVPDPDSVAKGENKSIHDVWDKRIATIGSGSDYTAFQDFMGIPSLDMSFGGQDKNGPVYHYHSNYDSFHWMEKFGDPGFHYHTAMAKIWGLITLNLAENIIVPFNATAYAHALNSYLARIVSLLENGDQPGDEDPPHPMKFSHNHGHDHGHDHDHKKHLHHRLKHLNQTIQGLIHKATHFDKHAAYIRTELHRSDLPKWKKLLLILKARRVNQQYKNLDRAFLFHEGLDGRELFKHVVFAPGLWTGYSGDTFPGLVESVQDRNWTNAIRWSRIIEGSVHRAIAVLH
ncbi:peptidase M28 [Ascodesmis nigricans]|uniref:Peptidase M28 n=1 Tax=Ascodesmis nigricans TaxID=341454 RepID=A0A4S2MHU1_9PEZI|nr:peptidase M28 [Ascodesmis nigricans]